MIIDSHLHLPFKKDAPWQSVAESLLRDMEFAGIDKTCIMPLGYSGYRYQTMEDQRRQAEVLAEIGSRFHDWFLPMLSTNPALPAHQLKEIVNEYVLNGPIIGIKMHSIMYADDPRADELYDFIEQHDIPLLFHSWYKTVDGRLYESNPRNIAALAGKHPKLRILMAHMTGCRIRGMHDVKEHPNVFVDTSGGYPEDGYLENALSILGCERVLYGSDYPIRSFATQLARIESVELDSELRDQVMFKNAQRFYRRGA